MTDEIPRLRNEAVTKLATRRVGRYDGSVYYEFKEKYLVDHDADGNFEYESLKPNYAFAYTNESVVIWNRLTQQSSDPETYWQHSRNSRDPKFSPIVTFAIFLPLLWFTLPKFESRFVVFVAGIIIAGILVAAIALAF